jgi:hypothetical protein
VKLSLTLALAVAVVLLAGPSTQSADEPDKAMDKVKAVLDKAESVEIYSLEPDKEKDATKESFRGWKVLGKTAVKDDAKKQLVEALTKGLAEKPAGARCFIPRHGVRAIDPANNTPVDLVICFECSWVHVYVDKAQKAEPVVTVGKGPGAAFDKVLKDAGVKLTDK